MGSRYFIDRGALPGKTFRFTYTVERGGSEAVTAGGCLERSALFSIAYVGQLYRGKGIDVLLHALSLCRDLNWTLTIIGDGESRSTYVRLAEQLRLGARVRFHGAIPHEAAMQCIEQCSLLVLPSRYDGWGATVNEALMSGVPVVCTDACGASELVQYPWLGTVVRSESSEDLASALRAWIQKGGRTDADSARVRRWAECISGNSVASYFLQILESVYGGAERPVPPWLLPSAE